MTPKSDAAAAERKVMDRYEARLAMAYLDLIDRPGPPAVLMGRACGARTGTRDYLVSTLADTQLRILRASAAALYPGDQQRKHLLPALGKMVTASCRVIRKSGK